MMPGDEITVDVLMLADGAQVAGDKLYVLGGGWSFIRAKALPANHAMAVALGILVGWMQTNRRHRFRIEVRDDDRDRSIAHVEGEFEQGRPAGHPEGQPLRVLMALPLNPQFEEAGPYVVRAIIDGEEKARTPFTVFDQSRPRGSGTD